MFFLSGVECVGRCTRWVLPTYSRFTRRRALTDMTFPSSLLGPTSRAQVDGLDPADGSKTSGHRCTWSVYELSRVRIERIEHHGGPGSGSARGCRAAPRAHLERGALSTYDQARTRAACAAVGPRSDPAGWRSRGGVLHCDRVRRESRAQPTGDKPTFSFRPEVPRVGRARRLLTVSKSRTAHVTRGRTKGADLPSSKFDFWGGLAFNVYVHSPPR